MCSTPPLWHFDAVRGRPPHRFRAVKPVAGTASFWSAPRLRFRPVAAVQAQCQSRRRVSLNRKSMMSEQRSRPPKARAKLWRRVRFAALTLPFFSARNSASANQYGRAERQLARHYKALGVNAPSEKAYPQANMLLGLLRYRAGDFVMAGLCSTAALRQLAGSDWRYKEADRRYLRAYCSNLLRACEQAQGQTLSAPLGLDSHSAEVDLQAVDPQIRSDFPIKTLLL